MTSFEKGVKILVRYMYYMAGAALVLMMVLTCVDIVLRLAVTLYGKFGWEFLSRLKPIAGTYELVCFLGSTAASFAMAHTLVESGHVAVSFLVRLFSEKTQAVFQVVTSSLAFLFFGLLTWQSVLYAQKLKKWGEVSMTLELPFYPFVYGLAFAAAAVCLVLIMTIIGEGRKAVDK